MACWDTSPYTCTYDSGGGKDYSSLATWESDTDNDLSGYGVTILDCYDSQDHSDAINFSGSTNEDSTHYRLIRSASGCASPWSGREGDGATITNNTSAITVSENYVRAVDLHISVVTNSSSETSAIRVNGGYDYSKLLNLIVESDNTGSGGAIGIYAGNVAGSQYTLIYNCICKGCKTDGIRTRDWNSGDEHLIVSCTCVAGGRYGFYPLVSSGKAVAFNCYGADNTTKDFYESNWDSPSGWNASKDDTSDLGGTAGDNYKNSIDLTDTELDADYLPTQANYASGGAGDNYGRNPYDDLSATYDFDDFFKNDASGESISKKDIRGVDRPTPDTADVSWSVGAGEYDAGGSTAAPTTVAATTLAPTTLAPTTLGGTTSAPTTLAPTTLAPTTVVPSTQAPTTAAPTTLAPTTLAPTTLAPTTLAPTTLAPTTLAPTTLAPTTESPTTSAPTTLAPTTSPPVTYETDFSEYSVGSPPSDWTDRWNAHTDIDVIANANADAIGDNKLTVDGGSNSRTLLSWDDCDGITDPDILCKVDIGTATGFAFYVHARASGAAGSENSYHFVIGGTGTVAIRKFVSGTASTVAQASCVPQNNTSIFVRFVLSGTSLKCKVWNIDEIEPADWLIETTDSDISSGGWIGVGNFSGNIQYVDYFAVGSGESPPFPPSGWAWSDVEKYFGDVRPFSTILTAQINDARAVGGLFGSEDKAIVGARIWNAGTHGAQIRVAIYSGGSLSTGPVGASLLVDLGQTSGSATNDWINLSCSPVTVPKNTPLWLAVKGNDTAFAIAYQASGNFGLCGDWQPDNGRWLTTSINYDETVGWASTWPADAGGSFGTFWLSGFQIILQDTVGTTAAPTTVVGTTSAPTTVAPTTLVPTTSAPTTLAPTTVVPSTIAPTTLVPTTLAPTTSAPTTLTPTTLAPTTLAATTIAPTTLAPTTVVPTTIAPTTPEPTTVAPTTLAPTTLAPTTLAPTTLASTTLAPTTLAPTTLAPTTLAPTTQEPTTLAPTTIPPTTVGVTSLPPTTEAPTTITPTTVVASTVGPTTLAPTTIAPTTVAPTTVGPTTLPGSTLPPTTLVPTTPAPYVCTHTEYSLIVDEIELYSLITDEDTLYSLIC